MADEEVMQQENEAPVEPEQVRDFSEIYKEFDAEEEQKEQQVKSRVTSLASKSATLAGNAGMKRLTGVGFGLPMFVPLNLGKVAEETKQAQANGYNAKTLKYTDDMLQHMDELDARRVIDAGLADNPEGDVVKTYNQRRQDNVVVTNMAGGQDRQMVAMPAPKIKVLPELKETVYKFGMAGAVAGISEPEEEKSGKKFQSIEDLFVDNNKEQPENRYAEFDDSTDDFVSIPKHTGIDRQAIAEEMIAPIARRAQEDKALEEDMASRLFSHGGAYM